MLGLATLCTEPNLRKKKEIAKINKSLENLLNEIMTVKPREKLPDGDEDPVENMLKKTGCIQLHYKVQECIAMTKDWRKCQTEVNDFRDCINKHKKEETANLNR